MAHPVSLLFENSQNGNCKTIVGQLEDAEWDTLRLTRQCAAEIGFTELLASGQWDTNINISWKAGERFKATGTWPSSREVGAVLHKMRPLILERERTSFHAATNMLKRCFADDEFRDGIARLKNQFMGGSLSNMIQIRVNTQVVNSERMVHNYLNAHEYHRDEDKRAAIAEIDQALSAEATRGLFLHLITEKLIAIRGLEMLIEALEGKREGIQL